MPAAVPDSEQLGIAKQAAGEQLALVQDERIVRIS